MMVFFIDFYDYMGQNSIQLVFVIRFFFTVIDKDFLGSPEESYKTRKCQILVSVTLERWMTWELNSYSKEALGKLFYEYAKRYVIQKLKEGTLSDEEELSLTIKKATILYDVLHIEPFGKWKFEVELPDPKKYLSGEAEITVRGIVSGFIKTNGQTLTIYNNWKQNNEYSFEVRGMKNSYRSKPFFQFDQRCDIKCGTVIQPKGSQDFWGVTDSEDMVIRDVFDHMNVNVQKITEDDLFDDLQRHPRSVTIINHAPVYGQQIGGENNTQTNIAIGEDINEVIKSLKELLQNSSIPELEKGDVREAIDSILNLSTQKKSKGVLERVRSRLATIVSIISSSQIIYERAQPLIMAIKANFGIV